MLSAFSAIDLTHFKWAILVEIDKSEAFYSIRQLAWVVILLAIIFAVAITFAARYISQLISKPILELGQVIQDVERSNRFDVKIKNPHKDEIGETARSFGHLLSRLSTAISNTNSALDALGKGQYNQKVDTNVSGDLATLANGVNQAIVQVRKANEESEQQRNLADNNAERAQNATLEAEQKAREALIIKQALDVSATAVMIADANFNIIYNNDSLNTLMIEVERDIQKELPDFNAATLIGTNIDTFHKRPSHQRKLLAGLTDSFTTQIVLSGLTFSLATTPIRDTDQKFLGAVVEWQNFTVKLALAEKNTPRMKTPAFVNALDVS